MAETIFWFCTVASLALLLRAVANHGPVMVLAAIAVFLIGAMNAVSRTIEIVLWLSVAAQALSVTALIRHSWLAMWGAALGSFVFSILSMFSIGAVVFALTCAQLGAVVALRLGPSCSKVVVAMLLGLAVWAAVVPLQVAGIAWLGGFGMYQAVGVVGILVLLPFERIVGLRTRRG